MAVRNGQEEIGSSCHCLSSLSAAMSLEKISFNPSESVTYMPDWKRQNAIVTITNNGNSTIMYKWKNTRPGVYKMRPVYGRVVAGDKVNIDLTFKGLKPGALVPLKDHFTCMYTKPMASTTDVKKMFTNHKFKRELANQKVKKRKLLVLFKGHYDNIVEMTPLENDISVRNKVRIVKGKGLVDEEDEKPPAAAAPAPVTPVRLVFREQP